ncbi:MAG: CDP-paratose 2-epimerase [Planctomycetota bacterium]|nr:MAG: CDP-paratose 2-epimerase [Planctomycetota bacterium]
MREYTLESEQWLPRPLEEVFAFFSDARNLDRITPPWLRFQVLTPQPVRLQPGARIDYKLRLRGIPLRWQSEITHWDPPRGFVDEQRRGPYRRWRHRHSFEARDGGTLVRDQVAYSVPGGWLAPFLQRVLVGRDLERIFAFRRAALRGLMG